MTGFRMAHHARTPRRATVLAAAVFAIAVAAAIGQEESDATGALITVDWRLIEGRIRRAPEGFLVVRPGSRFLVLGSQVRVHGTDRRDAYLKLRGTLPLDRPDPHVALARWCIGQGMYDDARRELGEALDLAPHHANARAALQQLDAVAPADSAVRREAVAEPGGGDASSLSSGVLVTLEGRIIEGRITRNAGGYQVEQPGVRFVVPDAQVQVEAADRQEAFRKLRGTLPLDRPGPHVALARWCIGHEMHDNARLELLHALRLEPQHAEARSTLKRLEEATKSGKAAHLGRAAAALRTADGFDPPEAVSLGGLSPEAAREFVLRVQPVLVNKCGNASCHGPAAENDLRLHPVRPGQAAHRGLTERNLAAVLKHVDRDQPERSRLLTAPDGNHDRGGQPVFRDRNAEAQRAILAEWVRTIAADLPETPMGDRTSPAPSLADAAPRAESPSDARSGVSRAPVPSPLSDADEEFLQNILREERPDAFDPEEFNRRHREP